MMEFCDRLAMSVFGYETCLIGDFPAATFGFNWLWNGFDICPWRIQCSFITWLHWQFITPSMKSRVVARGRKDFQPRAWLLSYIINTDSPLWQQNEDLTAWTWTTVRGNDNTRSLKLWKSNSEEFQFYLTKITVWTCSVRWSNLLLWCVLIQTLPLVRYPCFKDECVH